MVLWEGVRALDDVNDGTPEAIRITGALHSVQKELPSER
jgi:hypothetical protein